MCDIKIQTIENSLDPREQKASIKCEVKLNDI